MGELTLMYHTKRVGNRFFITFNGAVLPGWSTYNRREAQRKARELDAARNQYFEVTNDN